MSSISNKDWKLPELVTGCFSNLFIWNLMLFRTFSLRWFWLGVEYFTSQTKKSKSPKCPKCPALTLHCFTSAPLMGSYDMPSKTAMYTAEFTTNETFNRRRLKVLPQGNSYLFTLGQQGNIVWYVVPCYASFIWRYLWYFSNFRQVLLKLNVHDTKKRKTNIYKNYKYRCETIWAHARWILSSREDYLFFSP